MIQAFLSIDEFHLSWSSDLFVPDLATFVSSKLYVASNFWALRRVMTLVSGDG